MEIQDLLKRKRRLSKGDAAWIKLGDSISEDKKLFWADFLKMFEDIEGSSFSIKKKK